MYLAQIIVKIIKRKKHRCGDEMPVNKWQDAEIRVLQDLYHDAKKKKLLSLLPGRNWNAIRIKAERLRVLKHDGKTIHVHNNGYVLVRAPNYPDSWRGKWKDGRIYEHNLVWYLCNPNDPILQDEVIHHANGMKDDNRIENLQKLKAGDHGYYTMKGFQHDPIKTDYTSLSVPEEIASIKIGSLLEDACREEIEREIAKESMRRFET